MLARYKHGKLSGAEMQQFAQAVADGTFDDLVKEDVLKTLHEPKVSGKKGILRILTVRRYKVAAAVVAGVVAGGLSFLLLTRHSRQADITARRNVEADFPPGSHKAVLTLADGSVVELDSTGAVIPAQGNAIAQASGGQLHYQGGSSGPESLYNTLRTPRGGQYKIKLADGTQVWLNAGSSLRFPIQFHKGERTVELKGEAYFEVAKDAARPFRVKAGKMDVAVLGTHFNVMAYENEETIQATLLEGAVNVMAGNEQQRLAPGQQASMPASGHIAVKEVDVEEAVAWKNGLFIFQDAGITTIMRQIERWYDVEVEYEGAPKDIQLNGEVYRSYNLSQVLAVLKAAGLQFKIEGKKVVIIS